MGKKNPYLQKQQAIINAYRQAEKETYIQFMADMYSLSLNNPEIMGRDVFGKGRLKVVAADVCKNFEQFHGALEKNVEADYIQVRLDERLRLIFKDELDPFGERYPWIKNPIT